MEELTELQNRIKLAIDLIDVGCGNCKDCDNDCDSLKLKKILTGDKLLYCCDMCMEFVEKLNEEGLCNECAEYEVIN